MYLVVKHIITADFGGLIGKRETNLLLTLSLIVMKNARHFLLMVATLLCSIAVRAEGATALPQMSTDLENPVFYTISNTRSTSGKYLYYAGDNVGLRDANDITLASLFYFTGTAEACYIHNAATTKKVASVTSWTDAGIEWTIGVTPYGDGTTGLCMSKG